MSTLRELLSYLRRPEVRELVLQTDATPALRVGDELRALSSERLGPGDVEALVTGSPLEPLVPSADTRGDTASVELDGAHYAVKVARTGPRLQVRIARAPRVAARPRADAEQTQRARYAPSGIALDAPEPPDEVVAPRVSAEASEPSERQPAPPVAVTAGEPAASELARLLASARAERASDVHVMAGDPLRVRIAGIMRPEGGVRSDGEVRALLEPLLDARQRARLEELGYADFGLELPGAGRLRVNVSRQRTGLKGCFRLVASEPPKLEALGLPEELGRVAMYHQGLVIVSGPSGHGKTTTMASLVARLNEEKPIHIITVEDPVEVLHPVKRAIVTQREVGLHTDSFKAALKGALREDPDVIAIGELRDRETVEMALGAAETGHLVLATMSTPSGARTIDRLIDMFPPDDQAQVRATLAGALKLIISQRLVPTVDGSRLVAAAELITGGIPLWTLIRDNKLFQLPSLLQRGRAYGMIRFDDSLAELVRRGLVEREVARTYADDPRLPQLDALDQPAPPPEAPAAPQQRGFLGWRGR